MPTSFGFKLLYITEYIEFKTFPTFQSSG